MRHSEFWANLSSDFVVMEIHQSSCVLRNLARVDEQPREFESVLDVGAAATPSPTLVGDSVVFATITAAVGQVALHAGFGDGVGDTGRRDRLAEGRLPVACPRISRRQRGK